MLDLIEQRIKELYGKKKSFCEAHNYAYKDFSKKLKTLNNRITWINDFIKPLGLEIQIADRQNRGGDF